MASSIVTSAAKQLGNLVMEEAKYLYKLRDKIESLQIELKWMACFLRDADTQQHKEEVICIWVSQVRDLAYDAEDLMERYLHQVPLHRRDGIQNTLKWFSCILWTCNAWTLHNLGSEIDNLTVKISELTFRLQRYGIQIIRPTRSLDYNNTIREERRTYSHTEEDVVGLTKDIPQVVEQLLKTEVKVVGIYGTGGLGKTTLARKVLKHKEIKDRFNENCAWVYISKEFDHMSIFQAILSQLEKGKEERKMNEENNNDDVGRRTEQPTGERNHDAKRMPEEMPGEISKLLQEKKWLVVVDDIWDVKAWERLKPAFESIFTTASSSLSSSKILLTTRSQSLVRDVDPSGYPHPLQPLSDEESWKLLKQKAFIRPGTTGGESSNPAQSNISQNEPDQDTPKAKDEPDQMEKLGRKMLEHCKGLPIAIVALGGILSSRKTTSEWGDVEKKISSYLMGGKEQGGELLKVLELSYFDLPFYLKPCFLYLGTFPEDHQISTQRLYHLWEAEGLLTVEGEAQENEGTSYDIGERYLNELVQRSMVQVEKFWAGGKIKSCQVHDIMRYMCLKKCKEVCFLRYIECTRSNGASIMPAFSNEIKKLRRWAVFDENGDFLDTHCKNGDDVIGVRSLLVFRKVGTLQKMWKAFPLLRVLDLEGADIDSIDGVENLIHLRYLSLRKSRVSVLPSGLYDLKYLETLDLRCEISEILNRFYKMKRLRHLYLPTKYFVEGDEKLMFPAGNQMETIKNCRLAVCKTEELMEMTNLRIFSIDKVIFDGHTADQLKWVLKAPMIKKEGQLINCLRLHINGDLIKEELEMLSWATRHSCFKELKVLGRLRLEDRNMGNANATTLNSSTLLPDGLIRLELENCEIGEGDLLALEKLRHLEYLLLGRPIILERGRNRLSLSPGSFPQLRELRLRYSQPEWDGLEVGEGALPNLQSLNLIGCSKVENMPNSLTQVVLKRYEIGAGGGALLLALEKLPRLQQLLIEPLGVAEGNNKLSFSPNSFLQLIKLHIYSPTRREEWEWEIGDGALPNLKSLELYRWNKNMVKNIPNNVTYVNLGRCEIGEGFFLSALEKHSRLEKLKILLSATLDNKMSFSPGSFPQLTHLLLHGIHRLEEWGQEVGDGALPNLKSLELKWCKTLTKLKNIPNSLTRVKLGICHIGEGRLLLSTFENLPQLEQLEINNSELVGNKMSFSPSSFPRLTQLRLEYIKRLEKWEVGERALPTLQRLELYRCYDLKKIEVGDGALPTLQHLELNCCEKLKKLPEGLPDSIHIECEDPCIKGIEKYNTCPYFKKQSSRRSKPKRWLHNSCA